MAAIERVLRGIAQFRKSPIKSALAQQMGFQKPLTVEDQYYALMVTCIDVRLQPSKFTNTDASTTLFKLRSAGNFFPNKSVLKSMTDSSSGDATTIVSSETAALEFACVYNHIRHILVCGHSDCRAMNYLYTNEEKKDSPLTACLYHYGNPTMEKFRAFKEDPKKPLTFIPKIPIQSFDAVIDPENAMRPQDQLSQVNTLQQVENIASHDILQKMLEAGPSRERLHLHALWHDVGTAEVYWFAKEQNRFVPVDDNLVENELKKLELDNRW